MPHFSLQLRQVGISEREWHEFGLRDRAPRLRFDLGRMVQQHIAQ